MSLAEKQLGGSFESPVYGTMFELQFGYAKKGGLLMDTIQRLYEILDDRGMSLFALAKEAAICPSTFASTIKRGGQLSIETIDRICQVLELRPYEFFMTDEDWNELELFCEKKGQQYAKKSSQENPCFSGHLQTGT